MNLDNRLKNKKSGLPNGSMSRPDRVYDSSKYDGWVGSIYSEDRYVTRGKFSRAKFEENCLTEYAEMFPTVCGDLTFYQFPSE